MIQALGYDWQQTPAVVWGLPLNERKRHPDNSKQAKFWNSLLTSARPDILFTVLRDPVTRFISGYTNRILFYKKAKFITFDEFVNIAPKWPSQDVGHHLQPMVKILGQDPSMFTEVFSIDQVDTAVTQLLEKISGKKIEPVRRQTGGNHHQKDIVLTPEQKEKIQNIYADDYKYWWNPQVLPHVFKDNDQ